MLRRSGTLPGRAAPSRAVINPVQSCSFRHALIAALCVSLNDRQFVTAAFLTNLSFSAPIHSPPFFFAASPLSPSPTAFLQCASSSLSSSPRLLYAISILPFIRMISELPSLCVPAQNP